MAQQLAVHLGLAVGISSGANLIGAINLHVEAPAPQTIVQAASPAHPQRAPETHVARSGLSRRYLRSF